VSITGAGCGVVSPVSGAPGVPDDAAGPRVANARLRELLGERDAEIAALRSVLAEPDELRKQVAELQAQVADLAARLRQKIEELLAAAVAGRAGQGGPEVAADEDRPEAGPAGRAAGRDDAAE
jgi:hypothetical protein